MPSTPRDIRRASPADSPAGSSPAPSVHSSRHTRHASIARLGSPVPGRLSMGDGGVPQIPTPSQLAANDEDLPEIEDQTLLPGPGKSALSTALAGTPRDHSSLRIGSPLPQNLIAGLGSHDRAPNSNYGSFDHREMAGSPLPVENPEVVKRHLVHFESRSGLRSSIRMPARETEPGLESDEFSSLRLQGGDMTREIYRWAEDPDGSHRGRAKRSQSFNVVRPPPEDDTLDKKNIMIPGGFRRNFLRRTADSPAPSTQGRSAAPSQGPAQNNGNAPKPLFTNNFLEFLTLYGHFAGEDLEEDDEDLEPDEYFSAVPWDEYPEGQDSGERSALLTPGTPGRRRRKVRERGATGTNGQLNAALLLLKSFVGTGVLFLPRAFLNGGMLFSSLMLLGVAALSFYCFLLLLDTRAVVEGSFGDMGGIIFGKWFRTLILISLVISQIGFVSAYTVFTAENLQAFVLAVTNCKTHIDIKFMVIIQQVIFLPLSLIRDIGKLGFTALIADAFILLGLLYLYYYDIFTIAHQHGLADIKLFNPDTWTLLIGTAIFTFEGVGLIIPIQESMASPHKFPMVLIIVMIISTVVFTSIGALSYAAYGSKTETVVLLNLPQGSKVVNAVQFLYSIAILLSTPLQLFPAIRIIENEFFTRSGKYNPYIKWQKNIFRFFFCILCALIAWGGANDLDKFVSLVGSFACVPLVYVYPPLMHMKVIAKTRRARILDWVIFFIGLVGCVYTTVLTLRQWAGNGGGSAGGGKSPGYCDAL